MVICGRGCLGYVIGTTVKPAEGDLAYATWDAQNFKVMAWIVNSIEDDIKEPQLYYSTVNELWDALNIAFANLENFAQLFELRNKARNLRQGDLDVTQYYNTLQRLWREIDMFVQIDWDTLKDVEKYKKQVEESL